MKQKAINYGIVLYQLGVTRDVVEDIKSMLDSTPQLLDTLASPVVSRNDKRQAVHRLFCGYGRDTENFIKILCDNDGFDMIYDIFDEYGKYARKQENILQATLYYVTPPTEKQKKGIEAFLMKEFGGRSVELSMVEKKELIGGFVISAGDREFDRSILGRYRSLKQKLVMR